MSYSSAVAEEIEALKSIYEQDLKYSGEEIIITLFPLQEKEKKDIYAQVDLCVSCSEPYPEKEPEWRLKNIKGLSHNHIQILYYKLKDLAKSLVGDVMIYNLAYCVQEFLSENNIPEKKSCYEEMLQRKELQKQEEYKSEVHEKTILIKNIQEKQKEMLHSSDSSDGGEDEEKSCVLSPHFNSNKLRSSSITQKEEMPCEHKNCKYLQFNNKILRGRCIEHDTNSIVYCAIDSNTGDQLVLQEWVLRPKNKNQNSVVIQQMLENIQNKMESLKKICHENLISYIDFKWTFEKGDCFVHVLQECMAGFNLSVFIDRSTDLDLSFIRHIITGILNALDHLHNNGIIHGSFNESSVYFTRSGIIKVGNYGIKKLVDEVQESLKFKELPQTQEKISEKSDILDLGLLVLKIMKLSLIPHENIMVPDFQPPELKDLVEKCLIENEDSRWTARKLLNHKFVRGRERRPTVIKKKLSGEGNLALKEEEIEKPYGGCYDENQNRNSWLAKEFKILAHLGSGSFGRVLKVKNKLDGSIYAIKAIRLNTKNKQLGKKMIREVKLLSKLNHENVVRYYFSWIETESDSVNSSTLNEVSDVVDSKVSNKISKNNASLESEDENYDEEEDEEDEEEDEEDEFDGKNSLKCKLQEDKDQSSFIVFLGSGCDDIKKQGEGDEKSEGRDNSYVEPIRTMYIQMEFCEKSTLRIAINEATCIKLCEDETRFWRLFREIVEGLAYVHGQGMIHRDLKPENIFLDSSDHVKIGDFGLAISVVSKSFIAPTGTSSGAGDNDASSQNIYDSFHTGKVGTSLYVAPELDKTYEKSYYNEKVDIYSLGIIFFEMCNGPFTTDMERIETLLDLRKFEINLPPNWEEKLFKQRNLVKKLLNHDPKSRPSCQEILEGDYLPPAEFEYEQFQDILRQTLSNSKGKAYKYLVSSCFDQDVRIEDDIAYQCESVRSEKQHFILDMVKERTENILKKHGAVYLSIPLLLPQNKENRNMKALVQLMTHSGSIVNLPYDLRTSFARYLACRAFTRLRRYVTERVYKEKKVHGLHPKEQFECAFDLVTPSSGIENAEVEVFSVVQEIINDFKSLKNRNCVIRLNHSLLLRALLIHFNSEKWYTDVFRILADAKENKYFKSKIESGLQLLGSQIGTALINFLTKEDSFNNVKKELLSLINKRGKALDMLNKAFEQLSNVIAKAERGGIEVPMKIALGVVCNSEQCSDIMFDVVFRVKQKRKKEETVTLMSGCRYDGLIASFRMLFDLTALNPGDCQSSAVGFSIYLDKIAVVLKEDNILSEYVVVCSFGNGILTQAKQSLARKLWESGIKGYVEETIETLEELTEYCRENKITHIVNIKDEESGFVYVMTWDNDKNHYLERKIGVRDLIEHILKYNKTSEGHSSPLFSRYPSEPLGKTISGDVVNGSQSVNIHVISDEKLTANQRRRWESQLKARSSAAISLFSNRARVEVVGVFLDERKLKDFALNFKTNDPSDNFLSEIESSWKSMKQYILKVCNKVRCLFAENSNAVIILYGLHNDKYAFILNS